MKLTLTGSTFGTSFGDGFCDLFEENVQKRNMFIIDRTRWEFGYQISGLRTDVRLRMREKRWFRSIFAPGGTVGWKEVLRAPAAHGVSSLYWTGEIRDLDARLG